MITSPEIQGHAQSGQILTAEAEKAPDAPPRPETMDKSDAEMLFRCIMQLARHFARKYGFTIKQWPEK